LVPKCFSPSILSSTSPVFLTKSELFKSSKVSAFKAYDAVVAVEAFPSKEPVIPFVTVRECRAASDPLTIIFFQFGIFILIMVGYRIACPLPLRAYNTVININFYYFFDF
jgi:hypothetical protein